MRLLDDDKESSRGGLVLQKKTTAPDKRSYTLMVVPNRGNKVYRLQMPIRFVKACIVITGVLSVIAATGLVHYQYSLNKAQAETAELQELRDVNTAQAGQLNQLAKNTAILQEEMSKLNQLDAEVRRLLNKEELSGASRSGVTRPSTGRAGEGGPIVKPQPEELNNLVKDLQVSAKVRGESLTKLRESLIERNARIAATPSIWPVKALLRQGLVGAGAVLTGILELMCRRFRHPNCSHAAGVVVASGWNGGYGRQVIVDHGYGITTSYAHNSENAVSVGQKVKKGQIVAYMGSSGFSTGPHVHYEVRINGTAVNPAGFM